MKMKRFNRFLFLLIVSAITSVSAFAAGSQEEAAPGPVTFSFYEHSDGEDIAYQMAEAFNASRDDMQVEVSIIANDDYDDKIKVMLSGGADIDAFWVRQPSQTKQLAANGSIIPLDDLAEASGVDVSIYGQLVPAFQYENELYGLPYNKSAWLLFYNKDLFDKAGIDDPINLTWSEYADLSASLKTETTWGGLLPNWVMNLGATAVGEYLTDEKLPKTMDYVKFLKRFYVTDHSHPSIEEMTGSFAVNAFFAEGKTYMMINGDWTFILLPNSNPQFEWAAAPMPVFDGAKPQSTVGGAAAMSIATRSKKYKEAFEFIKFYCYSDKGANIMAQNKTVPAFPSEEALETYSQSVTIPGVEYLFSANVGMEQGFHEDYGEINDAFNAEITEALIGDVTIEEAFEKFYRRRNEIIAK